MDISRFLADIKNQFVNAKRSILISIGIGSIRNQVITIDNYFFDVY